MLSRFSRDIGFAVRTLRKNPTFTITAIVTIALGIGASTAIFSVVNGVLLRPLPYPRPERLALVTTDMVARRVKNFPVAPGDMPDVWEQLTAFENVAGVNSSPGTYVDDEGKPEQIAAAFVTPNFFTTLGARVVFGRNFTASDATPVPPPPPGAPPVTPAAVPVVISYDFWQTRLKGDSSVIGKSIQLNNAPALVVGVAQPGLKLVFPTGVGIVDEPMIYGVLAIDYSTASRTNVFLRLFGRLKPGASIADAQGQAARLTENIQAKVPIAKTANVVWHVQPMAADIVKDVRPAILALMGAVIFVLLIACANVANLLLVRASSRERELAVRAALGGNRAALIRQMFAESLVLATAGAALGLLLARFGIDLLLRIAPSNLPRLDSVDIDPMVLAFALGLAVVSATIFGIAPALRASRPNLAQTLRAGGRTPGLNGGRRLRNVVVVAEVALSFVLLVGSGLMLRSFMALERVNPGFDPKGVLTFTAFNARARGADAQHAYEDQLADRLAAIPGVTAVTNAQPLPLDGTDFNVRWGPLAAAGNPGLFQQATLHIVRPGYFAVLKTRILAGRDFTEADNVRAAKGLLVDELLARKLFPGVPFPEVAGRSLLMRLNQPEAEQYSVLGVVEHQRHLTLAEPGREALYVTNGMVGFGAGRWAVRTNGDPSRLAAEVRRAVSSVEPRVPVADLKPMTDYVDRAMAPTRFSLVLIAIFGGVAAVLAAVGLYGVLSTTVRQRTAEIGVRLAFGATSANIFRLIVGQGMLLSATGIAVGLGAALALTGFMAKASMLIDIKPTDPLTYASIVVVFAAIAAVACWVPARRAAGLDPNVALREE